MPAFTKQQKQSLANQLSELLKTAPYVDTWKLDRRMPSERLPYIKAHTGQPILVNLHIPRTYCTIRVMHNTYSINQLIKRLRLKNYMSASEVCYAT